MREASVDWVDARRVKQERRLDRRDEAVAGTTQQKEPNELTKNKRSVDWIDEPVDWIDTQERRQ